MTAVLRHKTRGTLLEMSGHKPDSFAVVIVFCPYHRRRKVNLALIRKARGVELKHFSNWMRIATNCFNYLK